MEPTDAKASKGTKAKARKQKAASQPEASKAQRSSSNPSSKTEESPKKPKESQASKDRRKDIMAFKRSRDATGKSFEDGNPKKVPLELVEQINEDPMALF